MKGGGARVMRARLMLEQGRYAEAERELRELIAADPERGDLYSDLAFALSNTADHEGALQASLEGVRRLPGESFSHYIRAYAQSMADRELEALDSIEEAIVLDPDDADHFWLQAAILLQLERWEESFQASAHGLSLDPEHEGCLNTHAMAARKLGRASVAVESVSSSLAANPENATSFANRGYLRLDRGDTKRALEDFHEALRLEPDNEYARRGMIEALASRHLLYRLTWKYYEAMSRISVKARWMILIGLAVARSYSRSVSKGGSLLGGALFVLLTAFFYLTWVVEPMFASVLRLHRYGRYALSDDERAASNWLLASWGFFAFFMTLSCSVPSPDPDVQFGAFNGPMLWIAMVSLASAIPATTALQSERKRYRKKCFRFAWTMVTFWAFGVVGVVIGHPLPMAGIPLAFITFMIFTWVGNIGR